MSQRKSLRLRLTLDWTYSHDGAPAAVVFRSSAITSERRAWAKAATWLPCLARTLRANQDQDRYEARVARLCRDSTP